MQASSSAGKTLVGLFDSQMKCIMWNWWYDNSPDSAAGRMRTAYYPDTGGELWQDSPATSSSFTRTGAMWYDRDTNSIRSAIDGAVVTLGEVTNASRIVSYLVIMTQRYDDVSLIDMRIHEISVVANLRATAPWMPELPEDEDSPATAESNGLFEDSVDASAKNRADLLLASAITSMIGYYWTGPWPELHRVVYAPNVEQGLLCTLNAGVVLLDIAYDLLNGIRVFFEGVIDWIFSHFGWTEALIEYIEGIIFQYLDEIPAIILCTKIYFYVSGFWIACDTIKAGLVASVIGGGLSTPVLAAMLAATTKLAIVATIAYMALILLTAETFLQTLGWDWAGSFWAIVVFVNFLQWFGWRGIGRKVMNKYSGFVTKLVANWLPRIFSNADFMVLDLVASVTGFLAKHYMKTYTAAMLAFSLAGMAAYFVRSAWIG